MRQPTGCASSIFIAIGLAAFLRLDGCTTWAAVVFVVALLKLLLAPNTVSSRKPPPCARTEGVVTVLPEDASYQDPLRWTFLPSNGVHRANTSQPHKQENDLCHMKVLATHRPTHEPWREETADYPYGWHLCGRKRLWEIRFQMRLKQVPTSKLFLGIEIPDCEDGSTAAKHLKSVLIKAVQGVIGDFYQSDGEDPRKAPPGVEVEPSTFVMPLWAFDQFVVSEVGEEPDLCGDLADVGMRRSDGLKAYVNELEKVVENFSTDKVYTFCIWGVSQFLDCIRWEARGIIPGMTFGFSRFGLKAPLTIAIYEMPGEHPDPRHLRSRKRYYLNVAMWSALHPPEGDRLKELIGLPESQVEETESKQSNALAMWNLSCCYGGRFL